MVSMIHYHQLMKGLKMISKNIKQNYINGTLFGHLEIVEAKLKALSDYLNVNYCVEYDNKSKAKITVRERINHD